MKLFLAFLVVLTGCSSVVRLPDSGREISSSEALEGWKTTLQQYVDDRGSVDFVKLGQNLTPLTHWLQYVAKNGPKSTPQAFSTPEKKMAYYLNSYNALAMYNVIHAGYPTTLAKLKKVRFFYFRKFSVDGAEISLYDYENEVIRKAGDERVHFALNCMARGCPRLPRTPFVAETLDKELGSLAKAFFAEKRNLEVDDAKKEIRVSEILSFFTEDFLKKSPSLVSYINRYRTEKIPESYQVKFIPYDWTINQQQSPLS